MLHLYWGNGKGKTTAAMGLALRALGHGRRVVIVQFLKDGTSGEIAPLRAAGAATLPKARCAVGGPPTVGLGQCALHGAGVVRAAQQRRHAHAQCRCA